MEADKNIGQPRYGLIDNGVFGTRIVAGIVTGIRYTEDKPIYTISFGKDLWQTTAIADSVDNLTLLLNLASLERIKETYALKIKYN
jgi:hypothetical protein